MKKVLLVLFGILITLTLNAQIYLTNRSFEENKANTLLPTAWATCVEGSTPDIQPGKWGVTKAAQDGISFLGLITRENGSYESIGQKLNTPLDANSCYTFSIYLARADNYSSYNLPLRLKIWGSKSFCGKDQLLVSTKAIKNIQWTKYEFQIYTKEKVHFLLLEACNAPGITIPYRGNILIDNISEIKPCFKALINQHPPVLRASVTYSSVFPWFSSVLERVHHYLQKSLSIL